jgi:predicted permease
LKNGVAPERASAELREINKRIFPIWRASYQDDKATWSMIDLKSFVVGNVGATASIALSAVALVWLLACANASNLLVARVAGRKRELAVRAALGASRSRMRRLLLAESALLAMGSVSLGLLLAWAGIDLLRSAGAPYFPRTQEIAFDGSVVLLVAALALMSALMFGLIPSLGLARGSVDVALRASSRSTTGGRSVQRLRRILVGSQFAVATPLLVIAGLLLTSLANLNRVDIGFDTRNVLTASIRLPAAEYPPPQDANAPDRAEAFWKDLSQRVSAVPGVSGVTFSDGRPPAGGGNRNNFDLEDFPTPSGQSQPVTPWIATTPEYFDVLGIRLLEGRLLDSNDARTQNLDSIVVDRAWARRFFPTSSAVGRRLRQGGCTTCPWITVVGVVSEVKYIGLEEPDQGTVYTPLTGSTTRFVLVRADRDPSTVMAGLRQSLKESEPAAALSSVATVDELVSRSLQRQQSLSNLTIAFAAIALILSVVGIYGVMAHHVQQHARDISIRMALGGTASQVLRLVLGQAMRVVISGVVAGLVVAYAVSRLATTLLFGIAPSDVSTFATIAGVITAAALLACAGPARRAVRLQPASVLRND